jgi:hypothetical protein
MLRVPVANIHALNMLKIVVCQHLTLYTRLDREADRWLPFV